MTSTDSTDIALDRLALLLAHPQQYHERRTETFAVETEEHYRWNVMQQIRIPQLEGEAESDRRRATVVSLGLYSKAGLPDMEACDADGRVLPILGRQQRASLLTALMLPKHIRRYLVSDSLTDDQLDADQYDPDSGVSLASQISRRVQRMIILDETSAMQERDKLLWELSAARTTNRNAHELARDESFRSQTLDICRTTQLLALVSARPGEIVILKLNFSTAVQIHRSDSRDDPGVPQLALLRILNEKSHLFRIHIRPVIDAIVTIYLRILTYLGMATTTLSQRNPNVNHVQSLHLMSRSPKGTSVVRTYWSAVQFDDNDDPYAGSKAECSESVLSVHMLQARVDREGLWFAEIQPSKRGAVRTAAILALVSAVSAVFVLRYGLSSSEFGLSALVLGIPAALTGVLAQHGEGFAGRVLSGPRALMTLVAVVTGLLGLASAAGLQDQARWMAAATIGVALLAFGVIGFVSYAPRPYAASQGAVARNDIRAAQWRYRALAGVFLPFWVAFTAYVVAMLWLTRSAPLWSREFVNLADDPALFVLGRVGAVVSACWAAAAGWRGWVQRWWLIGRGG